MDEREIRLRCIEAAAKAPNAHVGGYAAGVLEQAGTWFNWIVGADRPQATLTKPPLGLPKKQV